MKLLPPLLALSFAWRPDVDSVLRNTSASLQALLDEYPAVSARQRAKGKKGHFVTVKVEANGLGNRIGPIVGGFALALATRRGLIIQWTRHSTKEDPTGVDDLFEPPPGVKWGSVKGVQCTDWFVHGNKPKVVDGLLAIKGLRRAGKFRASSHNLCIDTDRDVAWGITCHPDMVRDGLFPPPWLAYGALMDYLLRPRSEVVELIEAAKRRDKGATCALGVHLRKADRGNNPSRVMTGPVVVNALRRSSGGGVYLASDDRSHSTRIQLIRALRAHGVQLLTAPSSMRPPTRHTVAGIRDALADNYLLSTCRDALPRGVGFSTFHDVAFARAVFEQQWPQTKIRDYILNHTKNRHSKFAITPADCPAASARE